MVECTALEMRHTGNRIGGSNPSLSASKLIRHRSLSIRKIQKSPVNSHLFLRFFVFTHSLSFAIIRNMIVGTFVGEGSEDMARTTGRLTALKVEKAKAARHVCRRRRALSASHRGRRILDLPLHAGRAGARDGARTARAVWPLRGPREGAGRAQAAA